MTITYSGVTQLGSLTEYTEKVIGSHGVVFVLLYSSDDEYSQELYQSVVQMSYHTSFNQVQFFAVNLINNAVRNQLIAENGLTLENAVARFYLNGVRYKSFNYNSSTIVYAPTEIQDKLTYLINHNIA